VGHVTEFILPITSSTYKKWLTHNVMRYYRDHGLEMTLYHLFIYHQIVPAQTPGGFCAGLRLEFFWGQSKIKPLDQVFILKSTASLVFPLALLAVRLDSGSGSGMTG